MRPDILNPLFAEVEVLKGIGPQLAKPLHRLGLDRVVDILFHLPGSWIDRKRVERSTRPMSAGRSRSTLTPRDYRQGGARSPFRIYAEDQAGNYRDAHLFQQSGLGEEAAPARRAAHRLGPARPLRPGTADRPSGLCAATRPRPQTIPEREPVYPLSEGLTNNRLADLAGQALARRPALAEWIEPSLKAKHGWPDWAEALETAHRDPGGGRGARAARL